jgi:hypothetical protein
VARTTTGRFGEEFCIAGGGICPGKCKMSIDQCLAKPARNEPGKRLFEKIGIPLYARGDIEAAF